MDIQTSKRLNNVSLLIGIDSEVLQKLKEHIMAFHHAQHAQSLNQSLSELNDINVSFEFFPPSTPAMEEILCQ
jgi:hypothetical protein